MSEAELLALSVLALGEVVCGLAENMNREHLGQAMAYTEPPFGEYHERLMREMEKRVLPSRIEEGTAMAQGSEARSD